MNNVRCHEITPLKSIMSFLQGFTCLRMLSLRGKDGHNEHSIHARTMSGVKYDILLPYLGAVRIGTMST
jgi:hypothetical protein